MPEYDPREDSWNFWSETPPVGHVHQLTDWDLTDEELDEYEARLKKKKPLGFVPPQDSGARARAEARSRRRKDP